MFYNVLFDLFYNGYLLSVILIYVLCIYIVLYLHVNK